MKKLATKLTLAIKEWIERAFNNFNYTPEKSLYFHFPNHDNYKGFYNGYHLSGSLFSGYTEVSESEFLAEFDKKEPNWVLVKDSNGSEWQRRIIIHDLGDKVSYRFICVSEDTQDAFLRNEKFDILLWQEMKPIETITIEKAEELLNFKYKIK